MNWGIFKAYDIRGTYPDDVNEEVFHRIGRAYTLLFRPAEVVVGMDARSSSPALKESLIEALLGAGVDVVDIGAVTTDMLYFAVGAYGYSGGIIVSASHNPKEYNGMKMVREGAAAISSETGIFEIRDTLKAGGDREVESKTRGTLKKREILGEYLDHVFKFVDRDSIGRFRIVANGNFGFVGRNVKVLADELKLDLVTLNFEPDGTFPKGPPDPMLESNRTETEETVRREGADLGVAWDADADRVMFFDEHGRFVSGAYITALLARILIEKHGSGKVIFDPRVVWPIERILEECGGEGIVSRGGHAFMKERMRSENALFAGEMSAHYYFRDNFYADNGIIPFLLVLEHLSREKRKFSQIMAPIMEGHFMSGELNYRVKDVDAVIAGVKKEFEGSGKADFTDGYSLEGDDWRFNVRPSNTEPLLRLNIEARKHGLVERIRERIEAVIEA